MSEPSIKGITFELAASDLRALIEKGKVSRAEVEAELEPADLELLAKQASPVAWVPVTTYARVVELLLHHEGHGNPGYLRGRGARAAEAAFDSGLYAQLRHSMAIGTLTEELGEDNIFTERDGRLMASLSGAIFNFGVWSFRDEPSRYVVEVRESAALPDVLRHAIEGFLEVMTERTSRRDVQVRSHRTAPDVVVFSIPHPPK
ncbi:MAG TPA: hypothetical protein VNF72_02025 [Myxococcota bacterium]|jgi:hypothetical protein|nr:hypothetical protein [Myxococcota bacterium]